MSLNAFSPEAHDIKKCINEDPDDEGKWGVTFIQSTEAPKSFESLT